ncbi:unnamed protein product [Lathyrus oleraceus]
MWTLHDNCKDFIAHCWSTSIVGCPIYILTKTWQLLKNNLKSWNRDIFGNNHVMVKNSSDNLDKINDQIFLDGNNPLLRAQEQLTQLDLEKALDNEERFWLDKSKVKWKLEGDINTLFFHGMARIKNSKNIIYVLKDGDRLIHDPGDLARHVIAYFTDLFCFAGSPQDLEIVNDVIPQ